MDNHRHDEICNGVERVPQMAEHGRAQAGRSRIPATPLLYDGNSYHGTAIKDAEQARLSKLYPRLHL